MIRAWPLPSLQLPTLAGALALAAAGVLSLWATPRWQADADQATATLRQRARTATVPAPAAGSGSAEQRLVQALPGAAQLPQRISALVQQARQQGVQVDSLRQQTAQPLGQAGPLGAAERVPLRLAGIGPYSAWRQLAATALQHDDALVLAELRLARNSPADRLVSGTLQWQLLQRTAATPDAASAASAATGAATAAIAGPAAPLSTRPADWPAPPAAALAAWQGAPAPTPPGTAVARAAATPVAPPPQPPFPYRWIGRLDDGEAPQLLLASAQRTVAVRLGATLDGRWRLLQGPGGQLQAQPVPEGAPQAVPGAPPAAPP